MSDALIDSLIVSGDEDNVATRITELLATGLDEIMVMPVPVADPTSEQARLAQLIGQI